MKAFFTFIILIFCYMDASTQIPKIKITDVEEKILAGNGAVLVINMWATFCKPCVAEIPSFIRITDKYKADSVKLMLVSLDLPSFYPKKVEAFAKKHKFNTDIFWLDETDADYFCPKIDSAWSGSIPATLIINTKSGYRKFFEEEIPEAVFEKELRAALGKQN